MKMLHSLEDAVVCVIHDQTIAGLDVITDGEQALRDIHRSFHGYLQGFDPVSMCHAFREIDHDPRGKHAVVYELTAPDHTFYLEVLFKKRSVEQLC